jgi:hypothetical protein
MTFSVDDGIAKVELAMKSKQKLIKAAKAIASRDSMIVVDAIAIFGQTVWACCVTGFPLGKLFYVLKFIRRIHRRPMTDQVKIWPSITDLWSSSLLQMITMKFQAPPTATETATMFTDASESGYGVVIFNFAGRPIRIFGGPWSAEEAKFDINVLELRALRIGVRLVASLKPREVVVALSAHIDNTTARAWGRRRRAPKWSANKLAIELDDDLKQNNILLEHLDYVESKRNFADAPSRWYENKSKPTDVRSEDGHEEWVMEAACCDAALSSPLRKSDVQTECCSESGRDQRHVLCAP